MNKVSITLIQDMPTVWGRKDWRRLRDNGILGNGSKTANKTTILSKESLPCIEETIGANFFDAYSLIEQPDIQLQNLFKKDRDENFSQQRRILYEKRQIEIDQQSKDIIKGKRAKYGCTDDDQTILKNVAEKVTEVQDKYLAVQINDVDPFITMTEIKRPEYMQPTCLIYKKLREMGWIVSDGGKFGVDFACYSGDPLRFHAQFIVLCVDYSKEINVMKFITWGRLASSLKKMFVLSSINPITQSPVFQTIGWAAF